jgi:hypothetical protein
MVKLLLQLVMAVCVVVGAFCPFGFWAAFEPGQERFLIIYPLIFATAIVLGTVAERIVRRMS